jgi:two-component system, chemotaxis family, protein-glutamate methylesterase/glutaminase
MPTIRVLVIDDSVVIRRVLCDVLSADPAIEVAGTAATGQIGLSKIAQLRPDLVTLDVEMPGLSGLETVKEIRRLYPKLPVIMFSTLTERGASTTLDALELGASDYVTKPSNTGSLDVTQAAIRRELVPKVKALCPQGCAEQRSLVRTPPPKPRVIVPAAHGQSGARIDILAIGTSTGGPNALAALFPALPRDLPVPIVVVQHMPPLFTRLLSERLNKMSGLTIDEGVKGQKLETSHAWIAPGDFHMVLERREGTVRLGLNQDPPENSCRPAVDVLFRSVAKTFGANVLAVVLTGMGSDGVRGCELIREHGGQVLVQDEASSVVWGMPGQVAAAGCADGIFPLDAMALEIERRVKAHRVLTGHSAGNTGVLATDGHGH